MKPLAGINSHFSDKAKLGHSSSALSALLFSGVLILTSYTHLVHADGSKIVKWKDASGVTHYGDKMPAQESGRSNSVLNNQGTVIKTNESFNPKGNSQETEKLSADQQRQDKALLASYSSVDEIDMAEKRNLKSDETALLTLSQNQEESKRMLASIYAKFSGRKMPIQAAEDAQNYQTQITKTKSQILAVQNSIAQTKTRFSQYRSRYIELKPQ
ncbi:DUF4124 domain-containing protein [Methylotenera versatilis]|uniref:DUF4124 domain-containing protein n=1 Tax=Methylotenera versatilis (strain 301) TaxID=666681 RepID=D7DNF3_METV0|nr:DUF4124 domain-containing protein [Methylotenera versatilis]ADI30954.1 conserved hypothetical protein [Methylotenera versatilis 301]